MNNYHAKFNDKNVCFNSTCHREINVTRQTFHYSVPLGLMKTNSAGQIYGIKYIFHFTALFSPYFTVFGKLSKIATVQYVNANRFISHNMRSISLSL